MPRITMQFVGGFLNGELVENVDSRMAIKKMKIDTGIWTSSNEGGVKIHKSEKLGDKWESYLVHVYRKVGKNKSGYFEYQYEDSEEIERCTSLTLKGAQCKKAKYKNLDCYESHKKRLTK